MSGILFFILLLVSMIISLYWKDIRFIIKVWLWNRKHKDECKK